MTSTRRLLQGDEPGKPADKKHLKRKEKREKGGQRGRQDRGKRVGEEEGREGWWKGGEGEGSA